MSKTSVKPKDEDERRVFEYDDDFSYKDFEEESTPKNLVFPLELNSHLRTKIRVSRYSIYVQLLNWNALTMGYF